MKLRFKQKVRLEGQACRKSGTPVKMQRHRKRWKPRADQKYWFGWWLRCPSPECKTIYMVEEAKVRRSDQEELKRLIAEQGKELRADKKRRY
jgi:hypothetical protein